ncbi:MAG: alanine--tRNA ligase [Planctomycetota bacterium]|jgi:alanyl-tRNA synthetase
MKKMTPDEIRQSCLDFFVEKGHALVPSAPLVPENDPTLLFTGAGMNQFKDLFLGAGEKPYTRATSCQKCFRTGDLEEVGRTTYHHTFFEMLGNFSFGDYFKREAIVWAWEYLTEVLEIPAEKLWASVYEDDDEAWDTWVDEVGIPEARIRRFGARTNFWPANAPEDGPDGVCGPCSEIFYDYGPEHGPDPAPDCDDYEGPRFSEVWNLVFTQFNRVGKNELEPLPQTNIDTGMGFERLVAVLTGELSTSGTGLFAPILAKISEISGIPYSYDSDEGVWARRIADHARAAVFCLSDGVKPGREGREFVLRRVIRRAVRDGISLGIDRPFLFDLAPVIAEVMAGPYPELGEHLAEITLHLTQEEERFRATYLQGLNDLTTAVERLIEEGGDVLPGEVAFRLHDERGFPVDVTEDYLREEGLSLDREGFERAMEARRRQSQEGSRLEGDIFARGPLAEVKSRHGATEFTGHEGVEDDAVVLALVVGEEIVEEVEAGSEVSVVTDRTPFYADAGGQIGDAGEIVGPDGKARIRDTRAAEGVHLMIGEVGEGTLREGDAVRLSVDATRRDAIRRNHTATHLVHKALKNRLGEGANQAGSLVAPDRLRFDFHFSRALTPEEILEVEREVNREIWRNTPLTTGVMDLEQAKAEGAMALFGEKYADRVRVVSVGDYSKELCGGTHCAATGDIGSFRIVSEGAIGAGLRRIEAVTGAGAVELMFRDRSLLRELSIALKVPADELLPRVEALRVEIRELGKKVDRALAAGSAGGGHEEKRETLENGVEVRVLRYSGPYEMKHLLSDADRIRAEEGAVVALLAADAVEGLILAAAATPGSVDAGFHAGNVVREVAEAMGGGGGGRPDLGQGKGRDESALGQGVAILRERALSLEV